MTLLYFPSTTKAVRKLRAVEALLELIRVDRGLVSASVRTKDGYAVHTPDTKDHIGTDFIHEFHDVLPYSVEQEPFESIELTFRVSPSAGDLLLEDTEDDSIAVIEYTDPSGRPHKVAVADVEPAQKLYTVDVRYKKLKPQPYMVVDRVPDRVTLIYFAYGDTTVSADPSQFDRAIHEIVLKIASYRPRNYKVISDDTSKKVFQKLGILETEPVWV